NGRSAARSRLALWSSHSGPKIFFQQKKLQKHLRNRTIAHIFATDQLRIKQEMRRDVFQAIADPTRRAIVLLLAVNTMTPNAIAEHFDSSRQAISKHIKILTECDLLNQEHQGREIHYH